MTLLSAHEDFGARTLARVGGMMRQLAYVAALRSNGRYEHWGLAKVHGDAAAQSAIAEAHAELLQRVLKTRLSALAAETAANSCPMPSSVDDLLPISTANPAQAKHLSSVVAALKALRSDQPDANRQAA